MANREVAVADLIGSLKEKYPIKGFKIHPALRFQQISGSGIGVVVNERVAKDENLLVIPEDARLKASAVLAGKELSALSKNICQKCSNQCIAPEELVFAVAIMYVMANKVEPWIHQAATWPTVDEMKEASMFYWDDDKISKNWNQSAIYDNFKRRRDDLRQDFDKVIFPLLKGHGASCFIIPNLVAEDRAKVTSKDALWESFLYAFSLMWSRAHGSTEPELIPLIELLNGDSARVNQSEKKGKLVDKTIINVDIARGKWPFLKGGMFRDDCNLPCTSIYANRDIEQGEELIISYGDLSPSSFVFKYGTLSKSFLNHHDIQTEVSLWCDPSLLCTDDALRVQCLRKNGYPLEELKSNKWVLCDLLVNDGSLQNYMRGSEPDSIKSVRQMLILSKLADREELERNLAKGLLRGPLFTDRVLPLLCQLIDYNIERLAPGTDATSFSDVARAEDPETPGYEKAALLARVAYRETLIMWRHAIARQGTAISHVDVSKPNTRDDLHPCLTDGGCVVCGRTHPSHRCGRCKQIKYCSRGHQRLDWKSHKAACGK